jgi:hypothetical protein
MSIDGRWAPHSSPPGTSHPATLALLAPCGFCWAEPGTPCTDVGQHYARFLRIYRRGILDTAGLAAVSKATAYITAGTIIPDAPLPKSAAKIPEPR